MSPGPRMIVFDISQTTFSNWSPSVFGAIFLVIYVVVLTSAPKLSTRVLASVGLVFALAVAIIGQWSTLAEFNDLHSRYARGDYEVVQGIVDNFEPASGAGNIPERFEVSGVAFEVSAPGQTAAYHQTSRSGGPNLSGRCVRIAYTTERQILWLGILRRIDCIPVASRPHAER